MKFSKKSTDILTENLCFTDYTIVTEEISNLELEIERLNNIIKHTDSWIDRTIEIIKQQPSEDDTWILERLNGIKQCLQGSDKE